MQNERSKPNKNTNSVLIIDRTSLLTRLPQEWGLNSCGLKRICLDSSSWTFGIQGKNSMKSRDEIVIIMLQWLRLYTLGSRGLRELKTFLETRLISSRVDQKFKNKERVHGFLKRKLGLNSWMMERVVSVGCGVVGAILWCGVLAPEFEVKLFQFGLQNAPRSCHDRAAIGP